MQNFIRLDLNFTKECVTDSHRHYMQNLIRLDQILTKEYVSDGHRYRMQIFRGLVQNLTKTRSCMAKVILVHFKQILSELNKSVGH